MPRSVVDVVTFTRALAIAIVAGGALAPSTSCDAPPVNPPRDAEGNILGSPGEKRTETTCSFDDVAGHGICDVAGGAASCDENADCPGDEFCAIEDEDGGACTCRDYCRTDLDCAADFACLCGNTELRCVPAGCHTGDDCESGVCGAVVTDLGGCNFVVAFQCRTALDECDSDDDCTDQELGNRCTHDGAHFVCIQAEGLHCP